MRLYFLRHGLAEDRNEWKGSDFERPLTESGCARIRREAAAMDRIRLEVEYILASPLVRARQTAEIVADTLKLTDHLVVEERLSPGFDVNKLKEILKSQSETRSLMLVGHDPSMSETIGLLIGGGSVVLKKGSLARVDLSYPRSMKGELIWLLPPAILAG